MTEAAATDLLSAPAYCQYASGPCDQQMPDRTSSQVFFAYPSDPTTVAAAIEAAAAELKMNQPDKRWMTWRQMDIAGQTIFCSICKNLRQSQAIVADVTTLNFNLMFEIGYAIGLGVPLVPIRDTSFIRDKQDFAALGMLDTIGYVDFSNSDQLVESLPDKIPSHPFSFSTTQVFHGSPIYVVKGHIETEGAVQVLSTLKKSPLKFRTYDPVETPRLSLHEACRQVSGSAGVIAHLLHPERAGAKVHNARAALLGGISMALEKVTVLLQEGEVNQPIDYRDVVKSYSQPNQIPALLEDCFHAVISRMQQTDGRSRAAKTATLLADVDLGDLAAENEILGLQDYFVQTGAAIQARQGHARLVVGRKGSGKTAIFYDVRATQSSTPSQLVLDLKPEGHQFARLRDFVDETMGHGMREHTMAAFWNYILLGEIARKALERDKKYALRDNRRLKRYERLKAIYEKHDPGWQDDFSQRLLRQVDRICRELGNLRPDELGERLTRIIYAGDVRELGEAVVTYLQEKRGVWLLIDNLDKSWPVRGAGSSDILVLRALLDATRKLQRDFEANDVAFQSLVFIRTDIFEKLRKETPDKGKDTAIYLDWEDPEVFRELVRRRLEVNEGWGSVFTNQWHAICTPLVGAQDSFAYIAERTLMRPRDLLMFLRRALDVAINRGHSVIEVGDLEQAEKGYSEDLLLSIMFEITDTRQEYDEILYAFHGVGPELPMDELEMVLEVAGIGPLERRGAVETLLWFGFLGVTGSAFPEPRYSYSVKGNLRRLLHPVEMGDAAFVVHPAFRAALDIAPSVPSSKFFQE
jgi:nucleoside 2-deoxyribosyltransferase